MELAVAVTWAEPSAPMVAVPADRVAAAPSAGLTVNVTTPPATGSAGLLAVTVTASGLAKAVAGRRGLRRAAGDRRQGESLALEGADVDRAAHDPRLAALVGGDAGGIRPLLPASMAGLPGSRAMVGVGPP